MQDAAKGTAAVRTMARKFSPKPVCVTTRTSKALVESGEQRSPKYAPESTAPPQTNASAPIEFASVMHTTPIVAAVPNAVPVRNDITPHSKNVASGATCGLKNGEAIMTICATVPAARQKAVRIPIKTKAVSTPLTVTMPETPMRTSSRQVQPR